MQLNDTQKMAIQFNKMAREKLEDRVEELKEELELRIPDKYLKAHGWM